jgi:hypothetical protein
MWIEIKKVNNLMLAEMWKELFEGEGIPTRIWPVRRSLGALEGGPVRRSLGALEGGPSAGLPIGQEFATYSVQVPKDKVHVIEDVLRKL